MIKVQPFIFKNIRNVKQLHFFGRHGTEVWEQETGRRFIVDIELTHDMQRASQNDRLEDAIDYRVVYARARHVVENETHNLIDVHPGEAERPARALGDLYRNGVPQAEVKGIQGKSELASSETA